MSKAASTLVIELENTQLFDKFIETAKNSIKQLDSVLMDANKTLTRLDSSLEQNSGSKKFVQELRSQLLDMRKSLMEVDGSVRNDAKQIGESLKDGFRLGVDDMSTNEIRVLLERFILTMKQTFKTASPSKEAQEMGKDLSENFAKGFELVFLQEEIRKRVVKELGLAFSSLNFSLLNENKEGLESFASALNSVVKVYKQISKTAADEKSFSNINDKLRSTINSFRDLFRDLDLSTFRGNALDFKRVVTTLVDFVDGLETISKTFDTSSVASDFGGFRKFFKGFQSLSYEIFGGLSNIDMIQDPSKIKALIDVFKTSFPSLMTSIKLLVDEISSSSRSFDKLTNSNNVFVKLGVKDRKLSKTFDDLFFFMGSLNSMMAKLSSIDMPNLTQFEPAIRSLLSIFRNDTGIASIFEILDEVNKSFMGIRDSSLSTGFASRFEKMFKRTNTIAISKSMEQMIFFMEQIGRVLRPLSFNITVEPEKIRAIFRQIPEVLNVIQEAVERTTIRNTSVVQKFASIFDSQNTSRIGQIQPAIQSAITLIGGITQTVGNLRATPQQMNSVVNAIKVIFGSLEQITLGLQRGFAGTNLNDSVLKNFINRNIFDRNMIRAFKLIGQGVAEFQSQVLNRVGTNVKASQFTAMYETVKAVATFIEKVRKLDTSSLTSVSIVFSETIPKMFTHFGAVTVSRSFIDGLEKILPDLEKLAIKMGETIEKGIKKSLEIKSPSRKMIQIAENMVSGFREVLPKLLSMGTQYGKQLATGLKNALQTGGQLIQNISLQYGRQIASGLGNALQSGGRLLLNGLRESVSSIDSLLRNVIVGSINPFRREVVSAFRNMGREVYQAGREMMQTGRDMFVSGGIVGLLQSSIVNQAASFNQTIRQIQIFGKIANEEVDAVRQSILQFSAETIFEPETAANAFLGLQKAGLDVQQSLVALPAVGDLAAAALMDIDQATNIALQTMFAFNMEVEELPRIADALVAAADVSVAEVDAIGESLTYAAPSAAQLGIEVETLTAAIATMANQGVEGSMAGTTLDAVLRSLSSPTDKARSALERLNIEIFDAQGNFLPFIEVIENFRDATAGMNDEDLSAFLREVGDTRAGRGLRLLMQELPDGTLAFQDLIDQMELANSASTIADAQMDTFRGTMISLTGSIKTLMITALTPLLEDFLKPILKDGIKLVNWITSLDQRLLSLIAGVGIAGTAFVTLAGALLFTLGIITVFSGIVVTGLSVPFTVLTTLLFNPLGVIAGFVALGGVVSVATGLIAASIVVYNELEQRLEGIINGFRNIYDLGNDVVELRNTINTFLNPPDRGALAEELADVQEQLRELKEFGKDGTGTYTVESGDTLWALAREYNTTVEAIRELNGLSGDIIQVGQELRIPGTGDASEQVQTLKDRYNELSEELRETDVITIMQRFYDIYSRIAENPIFKRMFGDVKVDQANFIEQFQEIINLFERFDDSVRLVRIGLSAIFDAKFANGLEQLSLGMGRIVHDIIQAFGLFFNFEPDKEIMKYLEMGDFSEAGRIILDNILDSLISRGRLVLREYGTNIANILANSLKFGLRYALPGGMILNVLDLLGIDKDIPIIREINQIFDSLFGIIESGLNSIFRVLSGESNISHEMNKLFSVLNIRENMPNLLPSLRELKDAWEEFAIAFNLIETKKEMPGYFELLKDSIVKIADALTTGFIITLSAFFTAMTIARPALLQVYNAAMFVFNSVLSDFKETIKDIDRKKMTDVLFGLAAIGGIVFAPILLPILGQLILFTGALVLAAKFSGEIVDALAAVGKFVETLIKGDFNSAGNQIVTLFDSILKFASDVPEQLTTYLASISDFLYEASGVQDFENARIFFKSLTNFLNGTKEIPENFSLLIDFFDQVTMRFNDIVDTFSGMSQEDAENLALGITTVAGGIAVALGIMAGVGSVGAILGIVTVLGAVAAVVVALGAAIAVFDVAASAVPSLINLFQGIGELVRGTVSGDFDTVVGGMNSIADALIRFNLDVGSAIFDRLADLADIMSDLTGVEEFGDTAEMLRSWADTLKEIAGSREGILNIRLMFLRLFKDILDGWADLVKTVEDIPLIGEIFGFTVSDISNPATDYINAAIEAGERELLIIEFDDIYSRIKLNFNARQINDRIEGFDDPVEQALFREYLYDQLYQSMLNGELTEEDYQKLLNDLESEGWMSEVGTYVSGAVSARLLRYFGQVPEGTDNNTQTRVGLENVIGAMMKQTLFAEQNSELYDEIVQEFANTLGLDSSLVTNLLGLFLTPEYIQADATTRQAAFENILNGVLPENDEIAEGLIQTRSGSFIQSIFAGLGAAMTDPSQLSPLGNNASTPIDEVFNRMNEVAEIESPSKRSKRMGTQIMKGLMLGFLENKDQLDGMIQYIISTMNTIDATIYRVSLNITNNMTLAVNQFLSNAYIMQQSASIIKGAMNDVAGAIAAVSGNLGVLSQTGVETGQEPPNRAFGGSMQRGQLYEINEGRLPFEIFQANDRSFMIPNMNGKMISPLNNNISFGSQDTNVNPTFNITISANNASPQDIRRMVRREIRRGTQSMTDLTRNGRL